MLMPTSDLRNLVDIELKLEILFVTLRSQAESDVCAGLNEPAADLQNGTPGGSLRADDHGHEESNGPQRRGYAIMKADIS